MRTGLLVHHGHLLPGQMGTVHVRTILCGRLGPGGKYIQELEPRYAKFHIHRHSPCYRFTVSSCEDGRHDVASL